MKSKAVTVIRSLLLERLTHAEIKEKTGLTHEQIGMALSYLFKKGEIKREKQPASKALGRREVYVYFPA